MLIEHDYVYDWLKIVGGIIPPFCVEIVLRDGSHYFLHSVDKDLIDKKTNSVVLRIWDFREFDEKDYEVLRSKLNTVQSRSELSEAQSIHPKLDWANLRIHFNEIAYCVEWHDRMWPEDERPQIGFKTKK
jgi:hypothetical protein